MVYWVVIDKHGSAGKKTLELIELLEGFVCKDKFNTPELLFCTAFQHIWKVWGHFTEDFYKLAVEICKFQKHLNISETF